MADLSDLITVLVVTSPTASDPSTETIDTTIASVRAFDELTDSTVLIGCDGVRPEQRSLIDDYASKLLALNDGEHIRLPYRLPRMLFLPQWGHQANVLRMLLAEVTTPLVLVMEGDTPLLDAPIDWKGCTVAILGGELHSVRFLHESHVLDEHKHLYLDREPQPGRPIPYLRTAQWSQRPHLALTSWYRDLMETYFAPSSRVHPEDAMHGIVIYHWQTYGVGPEGWGKFKLGVYADPEPTMQRSTHLDGRGGAPKLGQVFSYPGPTPEGAPAPTLSRVFE